MDRAASPAGVSPDAPPRIGAFAEPSGGDHPGRRRTDADPADPRAAGEQQGRGGAPAWARRENDSQQASRLRTGRMTVANRLRGALAVYVLSLVALALLYARAVQRAAEGDRALAEIAERLRT